MSSDHCQVQRCREATEVVYLKVSLCEKHWDWICKKYPNSLPAPIREILKLVGNDEPNEDVIVSGFNPKPDEEAMW